MLLPGLTKAEKPACPKWKIILLYFKESDDGDISKHELLSKQDSKEKPSKKDDKTKAGKTNDKDIKGAKDKPQTPGGPVPSQTKKPDLGPSPDYLIYATFLNPPASDSCKFSEYKKMANTSENLRQVTLASLWLLFGYEEFFSYRSIVRWFFGVFW